MSEWEALSADGKAEWLRVQVSQFSELLGANAVEIEKLKALQGRLGAVVWALRGDLEAVAKALIVEHGKRRNMRRDVEALRP